MRNLDIKKFNSSLLRNATLICDGSGFMRTYNLNNGLIFKQIKEKDGSDYARLLDYDDFKECLEFKLRLSRRIDDENIVLPKTMYMKNDEVIGYTMPYINMKSLSDVLKCTHDLDFITDSFIVLSEAVKKANSEGIIFPDLGNATNILYDPKSKKIKFIDYDGLQVGDCDTFSISTLMSKYNNPMFNTIKYFNRTTILFNSNFDKATLLALYLYYTTHTNLTNFKKKDYEYRNGFYNIKEESIKEYLEKIGLLDTPIEEEVRRVYDIDKNNNYIETAIKKVNKTHRLELSSHTFQRI